MNVTGIKQTIYLNNPGTNRAFIADINFLKNGIKKPIVVFAHGFKGFKDWGPFNAVAEYFAKHGFVFLKFNFSQNGTTPAHPLDFVDLEAFGNDNHSLQLDDLKAVLDWVENESNPDFTLEWDYERIYLIGHSRGGSMVLLKAAEDVRVKKVVTWAAVSNLLESYPTEKVNKWKSDGVILIPNARTQQQMPVYFQYYEDLIINDQRLNVLKASATLTQPLLIIHGEKDETVPISNAIDIHKHALNSQLEIIKSANHTFGGIHPFMTDTLPETLKVLLEKSVAFLE